MIDEQLGVLKYVSEDTHRQLKFRINEKANKLLAEPLRNEGDSVDRLGGGILAVRAGKTWYHQLRKNYGFARDSSSFQNAVARLQARRAADLEAATPDIINEVNTQTTAQDLYDVIETYLGVPGDEKTAAGAKIAQAVAERKKVIPREETTSSQLTNEQKIWTAIGGVLAGAIVLDALAGHSKQADSGEGPRQRWPCSYCGGSGLIKADGHEGDALFNEKICPVCHGTGEGW